MTIIGFAVSIMVIRFAYRKDMVDEPFGRSPAMPHHEMNKPLLMKSLAVCAGVLTAFSLRYPYSLTAAAGAVSLMLISGVRTERVLEGVDWTLLLFFSGLFVVMHGVEVSGLAGTVITRAGDLSALSPAGRIAGLSVVSAVLSNVVSNVPAVMLLKPFVESLGGDRVAWLALAMSSTLAGNLTLIGSVANLIVAQQARKQVEIGFLEHFRVGALVTIITIAAGIVVLVVEVRIAHGTEPAPVVQSAKEMTITVTPADPRRIAHTYRVALLCDTDEKQRQGLQGFRQLAADEAALFPYDRPAAVTFWMGSVSYPLDIIFVKSDGTVSRIYRDCRPLQTDVYPSGAAVRWVIETAAGSGINEGDRISIRR